jgi:hypothetical protein
MLMTSALLLIAMREIWQWSISNTLKIAEGGYVPLGLAGAVYLAVDYGGSPPSFAGGIANAIRSDATDAGIATICAACRYLRQNGVFGIRKRESSIRFI